MRGVAVDGKGGPEVMRIADDLPVPVLKPTEVMIRVHATSVNRVDTVQRKGLAPVPPGASPILGVEAAGVVADVGAEVTEWKTGDRVMCLIPGGGYAEYAVADQHTCLAVPPNMSWAAAAATCETFLTAFQAMKLNADVQPGDHVLIHAGASGVGTAACQLCRHVLRATSITTSSEGKVAECAKYADHAVSRTKNESTGAQFSDKVIEAIGGAKVNLVIDPVFGGGYLQENAEVLAADGKIVVLAFMGGPTIPDFNAMPLFRKRAEIKFSTLRSQPLAYQARLVKAFREQCYAKLVDGSLSPVVQAVLPLAEVRKAHELIESNDTVGKIVLFIVADE